MRRLRWGFMLALSVLAWVATGCGDASSGTTTGDASTKLAIVAQPLSLQVDDGQPASFSVAATGTQPVTYQWRQGNKPITGANAATLTIAKTIFTYNDSVAYSVVVTDGSGSQLASQAATLTITPKPPDITESPLSQTIVPSSAATFGVAATGTIPLNYQWNRNGNAIPGATAPSYTTGATTTQNNMDSYTVTVTNGAGQAVNSMPATLTVGATAPTIHVDCSEDDAAVAHQVTYRRGVVESLDLSNTPAAIVGNATADVQSSGVNFLNATLDQFNQLPDAGLFNYQAQTLAPNTSGNVPLLQTFQMLGGALPGGTMPMAVQVSGTPAAYPTDDLDSAYEITCGATGNYYPLPRPGASTEMVQKALEGWISSLNPSVPGAIWVGTQEPSHTLGYPTSFDNGSGCANVPAPQVEDAISNNIQRYITYWNPIAQYLRTHHMMSGGIQLNAGNSMFYTSTATQIISAHMPLDYFTIQDYTPSSTVNRSLYSAYQSFQQDPGYLGVKVIIDRYGIALTGNKYGTAAGAIRFLQDEADLMPFADMLYGYALETTGLQSTSTVNPLLPQVLNWLQSAPAPLRPLTSSTSDLQAFALVQKGPVPKAYIAIWNVSPASASYTASIALAGFSNSLTAANLRILRGSGSSLTTLNTAKINVDGNTISGIPVGANEFLLISFQ